MTLLIGRRGFLGGLIAAVVAPAIVRAEVLMPIKAVPVKDIFMDVPILPLFDERGLDRYLLDQLKAEAEEQGFTIRIRSPRFLTYETQFNLHRRCSVELVR